jgi:hypothetical protein
MTADREPYLWLLKPTFLNRGRGIHVFNELEQLTQRISEYQNGYEEISPSDGTKSPTKTILKANAFVV